jgi:biotin transport system substrate-specific component
MEDAIKKQPFTIKEMAFTAMFAALLAICSWISIPLTVPITLQTFAVFAAIALLGTKCSFTAITVWILLGAVGVPVFAGFSGGIGVLAGTTGGYILGMLLCPLIVGGIQKLAGKYGDTIPVKAVAMLVALFVCYAFGTAWFVIIYTKNTAAVTVMQALKWCVIPFIVFDCIKIALAIILDNRIGKLIKLR